MSELGHDLWCDLDENHQGPCLNELDGLEARVEEQEELEARQAHALVVAVRMRIAAEARVAELTAALTEVGGSPCTNYDGSPVDCLDVGYEPACLSCRARAALAGAAPTPEEAT